MKNSRLLALSTVALLALAGCDNNNVNATVERASRREFFIATLRER